jgi:hypothetical protein
MHERRRDQLNALAREIEVVGGQRRRAYHQRCDRCSHQGGPSRQHDVLHRFKRPNSMPASCAIWSPSTLRWNKEVSIYSTKRSA